MKNLYAIAVAGALAAMIAGCGSSYKSKSTATTTGTTAATTPAASSSEGGAYGAGGASSSSSGATAVAVSTKHSKLGTILAAGPKHLTVYLFEADKGSSSACTGA